MFLFCGTIGITIKKKGLTVGDFGTIIRSQKKMKKELKVKQIVVRFDTPSYDKIKEYAEIEHRGMGEFVRHATLEYIENFNKSKPSVNERSKKNGQRIDNNTAENHG